MPKNSILVIGGRSTGLGLHAWVEGSDDDKDDEYFHFMPEDMTVWKARQMANDLRKFLRRWHEKSHKNPKVRMDLIKVD